METQIIVGVRHAREDGRDCYCGCAAVVGVTGRIVQNSDTPKLATFGLCVAAFDVAETTGVTREHQVAYSYAELGVTPKPAERLNGEQDPLFAPVDVMAGQMGMEV